uniref:Uncharacterized protein n=1 Tax=Eutreptiella gymnastica TaxID=73025 RepID=A0A7S4FXE0_9EUGL
MQRTLPFKDVRKIIDERRGSKSAVLRDDETSDDSHVSLGSDTKPAKEDVSAILAWFVSNAPCLGEQTVHSNAGHSVLQELVVKWPGLPKGLHTMLDMQAISPHHYQHIYYHESLSLTAEQILEKTGGENVPYDEKQGYCIPFAVDIEGRLLVVTVAGRGVVMQWDPMDRSIRALDPSSGSVSYDDYLSKYRVQLCGGAQVMDYAPHNGPSVRCAGQLEFIEGVGVVLCMVTEDGGEG